MTAPSVMIDGKLVVAGKASFKETDDESTESVEVF